MGAAKVRSLLAPASEGAEEEVEEMGDDERAGSRRDAGEALAAAIKSGDGNAIADAVEAICNLMS